jgi:hypothetical protein
MLYADVQAQVMQERTAHLRTLRLAKESAERILREGRLREGRSRPPAEDSEEVSEVDVKLLSASGSILVVSIFAMIENHLRRGETSKRARSFLKRDREHNQLDFRTSDRRRCVGRGAAGAVASLLCLFLSCRSAREAGDRRFELFAKATEFGDGQEYWKKRTKKVSCRLFDRRGRRDSPDSHLSRHERIPERIVHARGSGAHGYFQPTKSQSWLTKAAFLQSGRSE